MQTTGPCTSVGREESSAAATAASKGRTEPEDYMAADCVRKDSTVGCVHMGLAVGTDRADGHIGIARRRKATDRDFEDAFPSLVGLVKMGASVVAGYSCCCTKSMMSVKTSL